MKESTLQSLRHDAILDKWILSRLTHTVERCNTAFENYDLPMATNALHAFWYYDLCDVYLVRSLYVCL